VTPFGGYELLKRLGAGGMGEVFLARRVGDSREVVIKRVLPGLASQAGFVERFLDEVRVLSRLHHPNVVKVFDFGEVAGQWFLAMEYVAGRELKSRLPVSREEAVRIVHDCALALTAAHELRDASGRLTPVVHRDVSPHNLLIADDGTVKLIDFGIASLGGQGTGGGKLAYAAPEQLMDEVTSPASDQYSLGVVLWEALSGRRAFEGDDVEVIRLVTEEGLPSLGDDALSEVVARMTALDPTARFPSMREVTDSLQPLLTRRLSPSPPAGERVGERGDRGSAAPGGLTKPLTTLELAALAAVSNGMTAEEAEAAIDAAQLEGHPFALDLLQDLVEKGALIAEDTAGIRRFKKQP
jgi:serine/threonine protein kinase